MNIKSHHIFFIILFFLLVSILYDYQTANEVIDSPIIKLKMRKKPRKDNSQRLSFPSESKLEDPTVDQPVDIELDRKKVEVHFSDEQKQIHLKLIEEANKIKNEHKPFIAPKEKGQPWTSPYEIKSP